MRYKFRYNNIHTSRAYDIFSIFTQAIVGNILLYALSNLIFSFTPLFEIAALDPISLPYCTAFLLIFFISFITLILVYIKTDKGVIVSNDALIIKFGYHDFFRGGWYSYNVKFDFDKIKIADTVDLENNKTEFKIIGGDYQGEFLTILYDDNYYLLPLESSAIQEITEKIHKK